MKELLEEYGGVIAGCLVASVIMLFIFWCMGSEGAVASLTKVFSRLTLGS